MYHDDSEGVTWHSDGEKSLGDNAAIAFISFGAERKFTFKYKRTKQTISLILEHGNLLVMKDNTQTNYIYSLPISYKNNPTKN